jgi:hypothetical protein
MALPALQREAYCSKVDARSWLVAKSERLVLDPGDHQSPGSVVQIPLRSREELFEQFF